MNLDPQLLAQLLGLSQGASLNGFDPSFIRQVSGGTTEDPTYGDPTLTGFSKYADGGMVDNWDTSGQYLGRSNPTKFTPRDALLRTALLFGGSALAGGALGGAGGGMGAGADVGMGLGGGAETVAAAPWDTLVGSSTLTSGGTLPVGAAMGDAGLGLTVAPFAGGAAGAGAGAAAGGAGTASGGLLNGLSTAGKLATLAGGVAGALDSRDKTQETKNTSTREPWGPAAEWLKQLIPQAQTLGAQYMANPLSAQQRGLLDATAGLVNQSNAAFPGLLQQAQSLRNFRKG